MCSVRRRWSCIYVDVIDDGVDADDVYVVVVVSLLYSLYVVVAHVVDGGGGVGIRACGVVVYAFAVGVANADSDGMYIGVGVGVSVCCAANVVDGVDVGIVNDVVEDGVGNLLRLPLMMHAIIVLILMRPMMMVICVRYTCQYTSMSLLSLSLAILTLLSMCSVLLLFVVLALLLNMVVVSAVLLSGWLSYMLVLLCNTVMLGVLSLLAYVCCWLWCYWCCLLL